MLSWLINLIYPPLCCKCGQAGSFLCELCYEEIEFFNLPIKVKLEENYLDSLMVVARYQSPITDLIHTFKYDSIKDIGKFCGRLIYHTTNLPKLDAVTAVPLHPKRQSERGFNQAEEIATELARLMDLPYAPLLARTRFKHTQASLTDRNERLTHLQDSFKFYTSQPIYDSVLIIDDVATTGTTLNECAKVLKQAGFQRVYGLTLAHGN